MTPGQLIDLLEQAGMLKEESPGVLGWHPNMKKAERFAKLFFAAERKRVMDEMTEAGNHAVECAMQFEREECARLLEDFERFGDTRDCVAAILKRGQK